MGQVYDPKLLPQHGERFSRLIVLGHSRPPINIKTQREKYVRCRCDCGTLTVVRADTLWSGNTRSCGCLHSDIITKHITTKSLQDHLTSIGSCWIPAEDYIDAKTHIKFKCINCGIIKLAQPSKVSLSNTRNGTLGCINCQKLERRNYYGSLFSHRLFRVRPTIIMVGPYTRMHGKTKFSCTICKNSWIISPSKAIKRRCPHCSPNQSEAAILWLEKVRATLGIAIRDASHGGELQIPGTRFKADGINLRLRIVFEYHGDHVHGNPDVCKLDDRPSLYTSKIASDLYIKTLEREFQIREAGFILVRIFGASAKRGDPPIVSALKPSRLVYKLAKKLGTVPLIFEKYDETAQESTKKAYFKHAGRLKSVGRSGSAVFHAGV